jgi:quinol-cytochrome oxidoreductase complex cytochrome b subunit
MVRSIVAVIVSYVAMFVLIFLAFTAEYQLLGPGHAFKPGSYMSSNRWIAVAFAVNLVVAIIGGFICATIAKGGKAPLVLAIVVFVLGLVFAIPALIVKHTNEPRPRGDLPMMVAMKKAEEPRWVPFTFPIIGVIGVLIGGKLKRRS